MRGKIFLIAILLILLLMLVPYLPLFKTESSKHSEFASTPPDEIIEEIDSDGDLLVDPDENFVTETDVNNPDTDSDGSLDGEEYKYWTDRFRNLLPEDVPDWLKNKHPHLDDKELRTLYQSTGDLDGDGKPNIKDKDSDNDGLPDGFEIDNGLDPADPNSNFDDLPANVKNRILINDYSDNGLIEFSNNINPGNYKSEFYDKEDFNSKLFSVSPAANPRYLRTAVADRYENGHWYGSNTYPYDEYNREELSYDDEVEVYDSKHEFSYTISVHGWLNGMLPTPLHTTSVYSVDPATKLSYSSVGTFSTSSHVKSYSYNATIYEYDIDDLLAANSPSEDEIDNSNLISTNDIKTEISELGKQIAKDGSSDFEKASKIANYLTSNYVYDLNSYELNKYYSKNVYKYKYYPEYDKVLINMLTKTFRGVCTEFASAFVLMCRVNEIPARLVSGFAPGDIEDPNSNNRVVRVGHKHAWGEVLFEDLGWLPFEVTPTTTVFGNTTGVTVSGADSNVLTFPDDTTDVERNGTGGGTTTHDYMDINEKINSPKLDSDLDGVKNDKDPDDDNDGLSDDEELDLGTNPFSKDTDRDKLTDYDEVKVHYTSPINSDTDYDGLTDYYEINKSKTDPNLYDTDGGGAYDGLEEFLNGDPKDPTDDDQFIDSDNDGLMDCEEDELGTDIYDPDTDGGGASDKLEHISGLNPVDDPQDDLKALDSDNDGLMDAKELEVGSDRFDSDTDAGGIKDGVEYFFEFNLTDESDDYWLKDSDGDRLLNADEDKDRDNFVDSTETDPEDPDTDDGGVDDGIERSFGTDPTDASDDDQVDSDSDGLTDIEEENSNTDPFDSDTDNDGLPDGWIDSDLDGKKDLGEFEDKNLDGGWDGYEWHYGKGNGETKPNDPDTDNDRLIDSLEIQIGTNPLKEDTDGDGVSDWEEVQWLTDPGDSDSDDDGISDSNEIYIYNSDPLQLDSDGDGINDYLEIYEYDTNPMSWDTDKDGTLDWDEIKIHNPDNDLPSDFNPDFDNYIPADPPTTTPDPDNRGYDPDIHTPDPIPPSSPGGSPPSIGGGGFGGNLASIWPVIIGLILIVIIGLYYVSWRSQHIEEIAEVAEHAEEELSKIDDAREWDSIRLAIFDAYKSMQKVMQRYDFVRKPSMTPAEFEYVIASAIPICDKNLSSLTKIFEEARYSNHKLSTKIRDDAIESFRALKDELRGMRRFGAAS